MSLTERALVDCPCGARLEATLAGSIDGARHPHLKRALVERRLHLFTCGACGRPLTLDTELLYVDFERRQFVGLFPPTERPREREHGETLLRAFDEALRVQAPPGMGALASSFLVRMAFGYEELREKIVADDAGLSDLVLEALKVQLLLGDAHWLKSGVLTLRLEGVLDSGDLLLAPEWPDGFHHDDALGRPFVVERATYAALATQEATLAAAPQGLAAGPHCSLLRLVDWNRPSL